MSTFEKRETIGRRAQEELEKFRSRFEKGETSSALIEDINRGLGDSVEKMLLIQSILDNEKEDSGEAHN